MKINVKHLLISILAGLLIGGGIIWGNYFLRVYSDGRMPVNTHIANISISFMTPYEARAELIKAVENYKLTPVTFTLGEKKADIAPLDLGVEILIDETIDLLNPEKAGSVNLLKFFLLSDSKNLEPIVRVDRLKMHETLDKNFNLAKIAPKPATFYFNENDKLAITQEDEGFILNEQKVLALLNSEAKNLNLNLKADKNLNFDFNPLQVSIENLPEHRKLPKIETANQKITLTGTFTKPLVTEEALNGQFEEMREQINHEFILVDPIYSDDWYESLARHFDWITFVANEDPYNLIEGNENLPPVLIKINMEKLNEFIDAEISEWLDVKPEKVNIYKNDEGEIVIEGNGIDGLKVERPQLKESIEKALIDRTKEIVIPVTAIEPEVTVSKELEALGITERIGVGHTSYYGSPSNRVHNIKTGASKFNGKIIAPDEVFSFNTNLGAVNGATGYRKELVIKQEGTIPEYGGGLCQVSTTMYRAALFTGLPIVARTEHSYAVRYYSQVMGHGLDATIYLGGADLKFRNDTGSHILIQSYVKDNYELYFIFYGTKDGRKVEMEGPYLSNYHSPGGTQYIETTTLPPGAKKQVEIPHTGFDAVWYRYVTDKNGNTIKEPIITNYRAIPAKILVGAGALEETAADTGPGIF